MAYNQDFIPKKDAEFDEFFNRYYRYVNETCTARFLIQPFTSIMDGEPPSA
jgi:hypothetical protein